jgi:hypothetical protein
MVEARFPVDHPLVNKAVCGAPLQRSGWSQGLPWFYGLNGVLSFFFTATPLICTYSGNPFLYGG